MKLSLIDIDSMFYHSIGRDTLEECMESFKDKLQNCLEKTECTHWIGFTSKGKTFRNQIFNGYKANRKQAPPKYLYALKEWAIAEYNLNVSIGYEADDGVAYWYNQDICIDDNGTHFEPRHIFESALDMCKSDGYPTFTFESVEKVLCSPDKDLLLNIPGKHFNYSYKLAVKDDPSSVIKGWWVETSKDDSYINFWKSMVCGDTSDGVKGIEGSGEVAFNKILKLCQDELIPIEDMVFTAYKKKYGTSQGIYEFQKNYRLLHMLNCNEDFLREVGEIPQIPEINKVILDSRIEKNNIDLTKLEF
jgi:5'-3' exonuclease